MIQDNVSDNSSVHHFTATPYKDTAGLRGVLSYLFKSSGGGSFNNTQSLLLQANFPAYLLLSPF